MRCNSLPVTGSSPSHFAQSSSCKTTGMRSWIDAMSVFGLLVMMVNVRTHGLSSFDRSRQ